ncbi:hypothetical protein, partial [Burkholderia territorii]|uniref:hypothetical protein n=1 Tax=Burkholderia territorii TaxID=1503055 RepID=UPI001E54ED51
GSKAPARFARGLERLRLQAQPGSRMYDRALSWAPLLRKASFLAGLFLFHAQETPSNEANSSRATSP